MLSRELGWMLAMVFVFCASALGGGILRSRAGIVVGEPFDGEAALNGLGPALTRGPEGAAAVPIVRVFGDYECVACGAFERHVGAKLEELADAGRIRLEVYDATLAAHRRGALAALAVRCAARENRGWEVHQAMYARASDWKDARDAVAGVERIALEAMRVSDGSPDEADFGACMKRKEMQAVLQVGRASVRALGIHEVPTVILNGTKLRFESWRGLRRHIERHVARP